MNGVFDWLSAAANAIMVATALFGALVYGRSQVRRYAEYRRRKSEERRMVEEAYARLFPEDKQSSWGIPVWHATD